MCYEISQFDFFILLIIPYATLGCNIDNDDSNTQPSEAAILVNREERLPNDISKSSPETDSFPPIMHTEEFESPVSLPYPINTLGAEDSPFILPDSNTLYFFFTPDVRVPPNEQLDDGVTGIWVSTKKTGGSWNEPKRLWLQDAGKLALDGAPFVQGNEMWFASAREGYTGMNIFTAKKDGDSWTDWQWVGKRLGNELKVGELHMWNNELYYHTDSLNGKGNLDIWMTKYENGSWQNTVNIEPVNTDGFEGYPFISSDGKEMWFTRVYKGSPAVFRSYRIDGLWQVPELIVSQFAGEPTLDDEGNLYFTHHYYESDQMIESDIYVAYKKK